MCLYVVFFTSTNGISPLNHNLGDFFTHKISIASKFFRGFGNISSSKGGLLIFQPIQHDTKYTQRIHGNGIFTYMNG